MIQFPFVQVFLEPAWFKVCFTFIALTLVCTWVAYACIFRDTSVLLNAALQEIKHQSVYTSVPAFCRMHMVHTDLHGLYWTF